MTAHMIGAGTETDPPASARIPYRLRVGVTGHRRIPDDPALKGAVCHALDRIRGLLAGSDVTPVRLAVVSALAEGADRLVAREVLSDPDAVLQVSLPFPATEYVEDFQTQESRGEFEDLLEGAEVVWVQEMRGGRGYDQVGRFVADYCDILIALWNGEPSEGEGGTAQIVEYALEKGHPVIWVETKPPFRVTQRITTKPFLESFRELDEYNRAKAGAIADAVQPRSEALLAVANEAGLPRGFLEPFCRWILPYLAKADRLADGELTWFRRMSRLLFFSAAAAVTTLEAQTLFAPERPELALIEVALLLVVLLALWAGRWRRLHVRWLSYRVLAERFRSALFRALAASGQEINERPARLPPESRLGHSPDEWVRRAFDEVWRGRPKASASDATTEGLKRFIADAWIDHQLGYHMRTSAEYGSRHRRLAMAGYVLFAGTILVATLHATGIGAGESEGALNLSHLFVLLATMLPATAGAIAGLQAQHQYERNARRYEVMAKRLVGARESLESATARSDVRSVVQEIESIMLDENLDWYGTMRFEDLRPYA